MMATNLDHYQTLGIARNATKKDIKRAYHTLAKKFHPDKNPDDDQAEFRFRQITTAYETLKDDKNRKAYDAVNAAPFHPAPYTPQAGQSQSAADYAPRAYATDTTFFSNNETLRHVIAGVLGILALVLIGGKLLFTFSFWLIFFPLVVTPLFFLRDDVSYFICVVAPRHVAMLWLLVLIATMERSFGQALDALLIAHPGLTDTSRGVILAPIHTVFLIFYVAMETHLGWMIKAGFSLWFMSLFVHGAKFSGWIFFTLLFLLTLIARYDTKTMSDFVVYYHNLFSLEPLTKNL
jgi:hypothetical protein